MLSIAVMMLGPVCVTDDDYSRAGGDYLRRSRTCSSASRRTRASGWRAMTSRKHAKRAIVRQIVERVERLDADARIGIVEDRPLDDLLRAVECLRVVDLGHGVADRIERLAPDPRATAGYGQLQDQRMQRLFREVGDRLDRLGLDLLAIVRARDAFERGHRRGIVAGRRAFRPPRAGWSRPGAPRRCASTRRRRRARRCRPAFRPPPVAPADWDASFAVCTSSGSAPAPPSSPSASMASPNTSSCSLVAITRSMAGHRARRGLTGKRFGGFAAHLGIRGLAHQIGQRRNRLRRLHLADGLRGLGPHARIGIGARDAQQDFDRARIVMMLESLGGFAADRGAATTDPRGASGTAPRRRCWSAARPARSATAGSSRCAPGRTGPARARSSGPRAHRRARTPASGRSRSRVARCDSRHDRWRRRARLDSAAGRRGCRPRAARPPTG